jgi:DNA-directed RNA polymerase sigma subunit (sigma70/sigma32)
LPEGLPVAELLTLSDETEDLPLAAGQLSRLRTAYEELPRRTRHVLTVRLGLGWAEQLSLKAAGEPLGLSLDRVRQLQILGLDALVAAVSAGRVEARTREAVIAALRLLAREPDPA